MADDILARARAARRALDAVSYGGSAESAALQRIGRENTFIREARVLMPELEAEVERLRSYKSLPDGMVWQDYASPDDVCKIREPLDAEIERLRQEVPPCDAGCATEGLPQEECSAHGRSPAELWQMREAAIAERDAALADVERLQGALQVAQAEGAIAEDAEAAWRRKISAALGLSPELGPSLAAELVEGRLAEVERLRGAIKGLVGGRITEAHIESVLLGDQ